MIKRYGLWSLECGMVMRLRYQRGEHMCRSRCVGSSFPLFRFPSFAPDLLVVSNG